MEDKIRDSKNIEMDHSKMDHHNHGTMEHEHDTPQTPKLTEPTEHSETVHSKMDHSKMGHSGQETMEHAHHTPQPPKLTEPTDHSKMDHSKMDHSNMDHGALDHETEAQAGHEDHHDHHLMMVNDFKRRFFVSLFITIPILLLSPMIQMFMKVDWRFAGDTYILFALSTVLFIYGGKPFLTGAVDEIKKKSPAMMMLIALAISVAYIYSALTVFVLTGGDFFWELATLITIMLLGHWIEMKSILGASRALEELVKLMPDVAHMIHDDGEIMDHPVGHFKVGFNVLVKPGEKIPLDGTIYEGISSVNESMMTGESVPVEKTTGDEIIGGSINGEGVLKFTVSRVGEATFLSQVIKLVREAQASKSNTQRLADVAAKWLFYIAVVGGITTFTVWILLGKDLSFAIERAVTVIIISCPHALGLATPLVTAVSTSIGAKKGLLIRNRAAFEDARRLNAVVFDKTGTLTEGEFGITDIFSNKYTEKEFLTLVYSVESNSEHPIAKGLVSEGKKRNLETLKVNDYQALPGKGLIAKVAGREMRIVSPGYLTLEKIDFDRVAYEKLAAEGKTVIFALEEGKLIGFIALSDIIRDSAIEAVATLKEMNIESIMLTGDNTKVANYVGKKIGIDQIIAEVLPQDKAKKIDELIKSGKRVAMTGDGINDAPSLALADLGIAIGAGTDVAIETADVILVRSNPLDVVNILKLSKATYRKMIQNLLWATGYNIVALPLAAGVLYNQGILISPALGAVFMSLSTIIVSINARLLKID
ncbi:MAG: Cu2+-exporting ATPase [Erysipelotrichaceae bacterium]|nr:MAG: Cu2+-exporting [Erysipelotrichaceae bacterium]TXT16565.1 MAG: Cu2+-exporting ATPase [Erysipelotrichaceae bacterium]